jgi:hypothetical protein
MQSVRTSRRLTNGVAGCREDHSKTTTHWTVSKGRGPNAIKSVKSYSSTSSVQRTNLHDLLPEPLRHLHELRVLQDTSHRIHVLLRVKTSCSIACWEARMPRTRRICPGTCVKRQVWCGATLQMAPLCLYKA